MRDVRFEIQDRILLQVAYEQILQNEGRLLRYFQWNQMGCEKLR